MRTGRPKEVKRIEAWLNFGSCFYMFFILPLSLPYVNWAGKEGYLLHMRFLLWSLDLPLFCSSRLFPSLSFSHHDSGLLFSILTT